MSRSLALAALFAAGLAGACAANGAAPQYAWSYQQVEGEGEKLAYGAPNSDDVLLMMTCAPGSGRVTMSALTDDARSDITLASGGDQHRFAGAAYPSELGGAIIEAEARAKAPTLTHFAETGDLTLLAGGQKVKLDADAGQKTAVTQFFQACA
ncbi:MAG TPA: hypothetical protein VF138_06955 [Caulobacteraceae bacterium]